MSGKVCPKCGLESRFPASSSRYDGLGSWCVSCVRELARTPVGIARQMWASLNSRAENKCGDAPWYANVRVEMTREEWTAWAVPKIKLFMDNNPGVSPSVDRIENTGSYRIDNVQIISMYDNVMRQHSKKNVHATEGMAWCGECESYKTVAEFSSNKVKFNGLQGSCKLCTSIRRRKKVNANTTDS